MKSRQRLNSGVLFSAASPRQTTGAQDLSNLGPDPTHPSLHFKKLGRVWSARIGLHYRALGLMKDDTVEWFWIGPHDEYDRILRSGTTQ
jgi:hypothetical protein